MMKALSSYRLVPVVLVATGCLFALKAAGLMLEGGYTLGERMANRSGETLVVTIPASPAKQMQSQTTALTASGNQLAGGKGSWMKDNFNYPDITGSVTPSRVTPAKEANLVTGSVGAAKTPAKTEAGKPEAGKSEPPAVVQAPETKLVPLANPPPVANAPGSAVSASERALLERLQQRRQEIESRGREIDMRESMLKAAERKIDAKLNEIKDVEARITTSVQKRDEAEAARFKGIVTMYESMKPKEAARIFERLDSRVLLEVSGQMAPRRMSEILAQMSPESAERLTVEMAARASAADRSRNPNDLPKIVGR